MEKILVRPNDRNIRIKLVVYKKLKIKAAKEGLTISKLLEKLLAQ